MTLARSSLRSGLLFLAIAVSALSLSSAGQARSAFDGRWMVQAVAHSGRCTESYSVAVQVANGQINGNYFGAAAAGRVDSSGRLILRIDVVRASGALAAGTGLGRWQSPTCNGTWTARRA